MGPACLAGASLPALFPNRRALGRWECFSDLTGALVSVTEQVHSHPRPCKQRTATGGLGLPTLLCMSGWGQNGCPQLCALAVCLLVEGEMCPLANICAQLWEPGSGGPGDGFPQLMITAAW